MVNKIYTFYSSDEERDYAEANKYAASVMEKIPAFMELIKFISRGCNGTYAEISEKTIDDAFDCLLDRDKCFIYTSNLPHDKKEEEANKAELKMKFFRETYKSGLKEKR